MVIIISFFEGMLELVLLLMVDDSIMFEYWNRKEMLFWFVVLIFVFFCIFLVGEYEMYLRLWYGFIVLRILFKRCMV